MLNDRRRILELALESLELKKKQIEEEISEIRGELQGKSRLKKPAVKAAKTTFRTKTSPKRSRFTKEERLRRSQRMKEYWEKKQKKEKKA